MVVLGHRDRAHGAAAAGQPAADHAVHGDDRPDLRARRAWRSCSGARSRTAWNSASRTSRCEWLSDATGINISQFDLFAAVVAGVLVAVLAVFFQTTRIGRALRAVADDHQAALAVGIPLQQIWAIVWAVAGFVALVAGLHVGRAQRRAVRADVHRAEGAAGADPRRLRVGRRRDRRRPDHRRHRRSSPRSISGRIVGGGIESWFPYVLALLFLLVRPEGLFGEKRIERV